MANHYEVPTWAGKAPTGHHLDVTKDDKLIQKLMIDEKKCYLFGRNKQLNDFCIDHGSCSRVHAALVYHKHLNLSYLVDLGSTHGTFIGNLRLEAHKPTQLQLNSTFHFGASTRYYILRERPSASSRSMNIMEDIPMNESAEGALLGLPESQTDLDNLTEYNTAHNRRISMLGITDDGNVKKNKSGKRKRRNVTFNDEECVINPEDVDPNVGRFRNLVQTTVVPTKRAKIDTNFMGYPSTSTVSASDITKHLTPTSFMPHLYQDLPPLSDSAESMALTKDMQGSHTSGGNVASDTDILPASLGSKLGLLLPNPAPEVTPNNDNVSTASIVSFGVSQQGKMEDGLDMSDPNAPRKKKYAKEAWPGRKPLLSGL